MQILASHGVIGFDNEDWLVAGSISEHLQHQIRAGNALDMQAPATDAAVERATRLQAVGQLLLLLDRTEEAEEYFDRSVKALPLQARPEHRARSCFIAGVQSLHRRQLRTAWNCLQRTLQSRHGPGQMIIQAHAALAALYFGLGMRRPAAAAVTRALDLLDALGPGHALPRAVLTVLQVEFTALDVLRQHERLEDLAFWPRQEALAGSRISAPQARTAIAECRAQAAPYAFLRHRLDFLDGLLAMAYDGASCHAALASNIQGLLNAGLSLHVNSARHELALACIAGRQPEGLRGVMTCLTSSGSRGAAAAKPLEHDYCLAKLAELNGREDQYIAHYRSYVRDALVHLRQTCAYITVPTIVRQGAGEIPRDDVTSRLPGKYRRAYQYIIANLHRNDLSVREVADAIGVTERALQLAFRAALGLSPSALIRQCRMDRVRDDLSQGHVSRGSTTLDVARQWGVRSRSALLQAYKASFGELPSQTLANGPE